MYELLGVVRLQKRRIESELKVWRNGRVPSGFDTRLWQTCGRQPRQACPTVSPTVRQQHDSFSKNRYYPINTKKSIINELYILF